MEYIKSPLNYTGGKYKLLAQILPLFPKEIDTFIDLFGGGFNIGINIKAHKIIYNDIVPQLKEMLSYFYDTGTSFLIENIEEIIKYYSLSKENKEGYMALREDYNKKETYTWNKSIALYVLICYAFNNQIRFNSKGEYNMPFGKDRSSFNEALKDKFIKFCNKIHTQSCQFTNTKFQDFNYVELKSNDFVYLDPPYFDTVATYNENGGWGEKEENELRQLCKNLTANNIKFALSNNLIKNTTLEKWATEQEYTIHYLSCNYSNCSYHKKDKQSKDVEVLITNY